MKQWLFCAAILLAGCTQHPIDMKNREVELIVDEHSYAYNLSRSVYTTRLIGKKDQQTSFSLSPAEYEQLIRLFTSLELNQLGDSCSLMGDCQRSPLIPTKIIVKTQARRHIILIDRACNRFPIWEIQEAGKVKQFLDTYYRILKAKPGYDQLPPSNYFYM